LSAAALLLVLAAGVVGACGSDDSSSGGGSISLVAYSTPQEAYQEVIPAFQDTSQGKGTSFKQSYGASGDQARAVEAGLKADVVALSLAPDVDKLVDAKKVPADWNKDSYDGFVTNSVVVFAVRKGNPKNIKTWADLTKDGVDVITPNPFTSGGAKWNVMAAYGANSDVGKNKQAGEDYLRALFKNVSVQSKSAREALQTFVGGKGDAMIAYENDSIFAQQNGQALDYAIPDATILIENPVAATKNSAHPAEAKAFLDFLHTAAAQKIYADNGYRPIVPGSYGRTFPTPSKLFTISDLGGWTPVAKDFFDANTGIVAGIEQKLGVATVASPTPSAASSASK